MTSSLGIVDRMRWMSAVAGTAIVALVLSLILVGGSRRTQSLTPASSSPAASAIGGSSVPLDPRIATLAARHPGAQLEAIVQFKAGVSLDAARRAAQQAGGHVFGTLPVINGLAVDMTAAQARGLAGSTTVHSVTLNTQITPQGGPRLGKPEQWRAPKGQVSPIRTTYDQTLGASDLWRGGGTGAGVGVAVIDTGVDGNLPDFGSGNGSSRVIATAVTNPGAKTILDTYGHGTDVAGIIAGNGANRNRSDPFRGQYVGVAPDANLIAVKASDEDGHANVLNVIYGIQFAIDHRSDYNIRVINLSLNEATPQSYKTDPLDAAVEAAWKHGIVVVAAAGNRGNLPGAVQYAPANDPYAITVGAVDENGTPNPAGDTIASWSSRGTTQDGFDKPDVYAPGAHIVSVLAPNSAFADGCPTCVIGGQYVRTSGTSMAAPMISGLIADVLSTHPGLNPDQVKGALTEPRVSSTRAFIEPNAVKAALDFEPDPANRGLTPSTLLGPDGNINYAMGSWSMGSWSAAQGALKAPFAMGSWSMGSWSMGSWSCQSCVSSSSSSSSTGVKSSMGSWSFASWSTIEDK